MHTEKENIYDKNKIIINVKKKKKMYMRCINKSDRIRE